MTASSVGTTLVEAIVQVTYRFDLVEDRQPFLDPEPLYGTAEA